jgi:hypothetical protein
MRDIGKEKLMLNVLEHDHIHDHISEAIELSEWPHKPLKGALVR